MFRGVCRILHGVCRILEGVRRIFRWVVNITLGCIEFLPVLAGREGGREGPED